MSKKHKHRHNGQPPSTTDALAASLGAAAPAEAEAAAEETQDDAEDTGAEEVSDEQQNEQEPQQAEAAAPAQEQNPCEEKKPVTAQTVDLDRQTTVKPAAPKLQIFQTRRPVAVSAKLAEAGKQLKNLSSPDPTKHSQIGQKVIALFDEYDALCAKIDQEDPRQILQTARKLYDIMVICTPRRPGPGNGLSQELIKLVFRRLSEGYGSKYTDGTLFRQDYRLPTPSDAMKFDTFWNVMFQLVECAKTGRRITYNTTTVSHIINSPAAMMVITGIRKRLEEANK